MSKLDDILLSFAPVDSMDDGMVDPQWEANEAKFKQAIKALMLELIGDNREWDTTEPYDNPDIAQGYNEALAELREKVEAL